MKEKCSTHPHTMWIGLGSYLLLLQLLLRYLRLECCCTVAYRCRMCLLLKEYVQQYYVTNVVLVMLRTHVSVGHLSRTRMVCYYIECKTY